MNYEKIVVTIAVLTFLFANGLNPARTREKNWPDNEKERARQEIVLTAIEEEDYKKWRQIIGPDSWIGRKIDQKSFNLFVETRRLARSGQYGEALDKSEKLKKDLRLSQEEFEQIASLVIV